jgi:predicted GNAT family N-acyltransferase
MQENVPPPVRRQVPAEVERDDQDAAATHVLATLGGEVCGAARLLVAEDGPAGGRVGKIERVCVLAGWRSRGVGRDVVRFAVEQLRGPLGCGTAKLGAQVHALEFYESMGFALVPGGVHGRGEEYMDAAGVPHRDMEMRL